MRRLRRTDALRELVRETRVTRADLVYPMFVVEDASAAGPVQSMPGVERHSLDSLALEMESVAAAGLRAVILFGVPKSKDATGSQAFAERGVIPRAIEVVRRCTNDMVVISDVCLCQYTNHGHCGVLRDGHVDNDATLDPLGKTVVAHANAGADVVAPSGMMDGAVGAIRSALDSAGHVDTAILAYAVKYASSFYGPFRDAVESAPKEGNRRGYQMDPANAREALAEAKLDLDEGADILMVKPAMPYLDVLNRVRQAHPEVPLAAYQVSGEYSMLKAAAQHGWLDERAVVMESLTAIKRAGADVILTYFAKDVARSL
jgi:porphobilinogen synthase